MKTLWLAQIAAILRLEMRKTFFSRRGLWVYLLALFPVFIFATHTFVTLERHRQSDFGESTNVFASVFQLLDLRVVVFFGCLGICMNLFRGEVIDRSLHYYFLAPVRREVLVIGKYLAGLIAATAIFTTSTILQWIAVYAEFPSSTITAYLSLGNGWSHLGAYIVTTMLACIGYGSVFLLSGAIFRNPVFPAAVLLLWESINVFLPPLLQKFSVIFYLKSLLPIEAAPETRSGMAFLVVNADPVPPAVAIGGILLFTLMVIVVSSVQVRRMEINYSSD
jgi:ABC-type transport system involved in multi-copper enzyme maturation permease subunit